MPPSHVYDKRGIDRRLLLIGATLAAGSALASGFQMLSARAEEPSSDDKIFGTESFIRGATGAFGHRLLSSVQLC